MKLLLGILFQDNAASVIPILTKAAEIFPPSSQVHVCLIDNASNDATGETIEKQLKAAPRPNVWFFKNERSYGHGANQKILYRLAHNQGFEAAAFVRASDMKSLERIDRLRRDFSNAPGAWDLFIGVSDRPLVLPRWFSPYRIYRVEALARTAFELNTGDWHFDTELLLQLTDRKARIGEVASADYRAWGNLRPRSLLNAFKASVKYKLQKYNLFYDIRYYPDVVHAVKDEGADVYEEKFKSQSPHALVCENSTLVPPSSAVLDIGCSSGYVARNLTAQKNCRVTGVDLLPRSKVLDTLAAYHQIDLERDTKPLNDLFVKDQFDVVLLLDVIEHLSAPEKFLLNLNRRNFKKVPTFLMSTGNVAFIAVRMMLLIGFFNYGRRGILDITHKRLFSMRSFRNLMEQTGFLITKRHYFPFPFRALGFPNAIASVLEAVNIGLIWVSPSLFAYQFMYETTPVVVPDTFPARVPA